VNRVRKTPLIFAIAALTCIPLSVLADAGTPLMWAGMLHLVFGNLIIGIFEGSILAVVFKLRKPLCILVMIPANYFSAWVGGLFLNHEITAVLPFTLYNAWHWIWVMVFFTYLMTLVLEWPFVFFCFRKVENRLKKSLQGNVLVNTLSYVLLFSWYWLASGTSLYTKMNIVQPSEIGFPKEGIVYYISTTNTVCKFDFESHRTETICSLEASNDDRLFPRQSVFNKNNWDILDTDKKIMVCSNLEVAAFPAWNDTNTAYQGGVQGTMWDFGETPKLETADKSDWDFHSGFWGIEGLQGKNKKTGGTIYFALETPFLTWSIRDAAQLRGDYVVFQMGDDQICLLEVATRKIALLTKGQGPAVVLPINFTN
jgi:hypothetical protein